MNDFEKRINNEISKLENEEKEIKMMKGIKEMEFVNAVLQITVKDEKGGKQMAMFNLSSSLAKETLQKDIIEDEHRLKKVKETIKKQKERL